MTRQEKKRAQEKKKRDEAHKAHICKYEVIDLPAPLVSTKLENANLAYASPDVSKAKVVPQRPSASKKYGIPDMPDPKDLDLKKPKSGIIINDPESAPRDDVDSMDELFQTMLDNKARKLPRKPSDEELGEDEGEGEEEVVDLKALEDANQKKLEEEQKQEEEKSSKDKKHHRKRRSKDEQQGGDTAEPESKDAPGKGTKEATDASGIGAGETAAAPEAAEEDEPTYRVKKSVSQESKATSLDPNEFFTPFEDFEDKDVIERIIQKYRRDSDQLKVQTNIPKIVQRGTLESHSFTKTRQAILTDFYFGLKVGKIHQGDEHFSKTSRNKQGLCMAIAAYCYNVVKHPNKWTENDVDEILEIGDRLYLDSVNALHVHNTNMELQPEDVHRFCYIGKKKIRFKVHEPEINGLMKSTDKAIYNISKGLRLFFKRHCSGILQSNGINILIWKIGRYFFFDSVPRNSDLRYDEFRGTAILVTLYDLLTVISILLDRYEVGNWPFKIFQVTCTHVLEIDAEDRESMMSDFVEPNEFNILSGEKAVINGSFQLADKCFDFSRNKQALTMSTIALVYSRITPPNAWRRKTVDKIMVMGNQLFLECIAEENLEELKLDLLPAYFTLGPYMVEIFIYANRQTGFMYRKSVCMLNNALQEFFQASNSGILEIDGKWCLAVWHQRDMYYLFDPYARNKEGLKCRHGTACLSINAELDGIVETITKNFEDRESTFRVHAMKVLKINRDPERAKLFPNRQPMGEVPLDVLRKVSVKTRRTKIAIAKPILIDASDYAMRRVFEVIDSPGASINEIGSGIASLESGQIPQMIAARISALSKREEPLKPVDLDSPSLSDTQIDPPRPVPGKGDQSLYVDFTSDSFALTQDEIEVEEKGEGEGEGADRVVIGKHVEIEDEGLGDEEGDDYLDAKLKAQEMVQVQSQYSQVDSAGFKISRIVMTEDDTFRPLKRELLLPMDYLEEYERMRKRLLQEMQDDLVDVPVEPEVTQSQELAKDSNFVTLPDDSQLVKGTGNIAQYGDEVEYMAPFVSMMCSPVAMKYSISTWSTDIVDYILSCGTELYKAANVRYDQVPKLEIPKISLGSTDYSVVVEYLYDGQLNAKTLEKAMSKILFPSYKCGLVVTASYAVAVFLKHHLYYMFDSFGNNQCGLGEGPSNTGVACFARFKDLHSLVGRFMYNKLKREVDDNYKNTRFVMSFCVSTPVEPEQEVVKHRKKKNLKRPKPGDLFEDEDEVDDGEDQEYDETQAEGDRKKKETTKGEEKEKEKEKEPANKVGYQEVDGQLVIEGTKALPGREKLSVKLKQDHFVCVCVCLMLLNHPVRNWDTKRVDMVLEQGMHIYSHADQLDLSAKRTIKNILVGKSIFDIVVHKINVPESKRSKGLNAVLDHIMMRRNYCILQFPNCCYVIYKSNDYYHLFDPYSCANPEAKKSQQRKGTPREEKKEKKEHKAGWTLLRTLKQVKKRIRKNMVEGGQSYSLFSFDVTSITKAPKRLTVQHQLALLEMDKEMPVELFKKPYHEDEEWLKKYRKMPWTSPYNNAHGDPRGKHMWHNWDVEYQKDLFSLHGTLHQTNERFEWEIRGKQTLANLIVGIGMTDIYELSEWNLPIVDNILIFGNEYFKECIKDIKEEKYEISTDDLIRKCTIYPYSFQVVVKPILAGTMFLMSIKTFNLYKALKVFFKDVENRAGIICTLNGDVKRYLAFGKIQEMEYFMYDCQADGTAFHLGGNKITYILRCTTMNRLLHCLVLTLRSGDFFIYDVITSNFSPVKEDE